MTEQLSKEQKCNRYCADWPTCPCGIESFKEDVAVLSQAHKPSNFVSKCPKCDGPYGQGSYHEESACQDIQIERLTKALRIAELKASGTLANNLCPDHRDKQTGRPCLACEIERLRAALVQAVSVIQTWHNMEVPEKQRSELWDIYWRNAPELKQLREALRGDTP